MKETSFSKLVTITRLVSPPHTHTHATSYSNLDAFERGTQASRAWVLSLQELLARVQPGMVLPAAQSPLACLSHLPFLCPHFLGC